jgi:hypothetical protein
MSKVIDICMGRGVNHENRWITQEDEYMRLAKVAVLSLLPVLILTLPFSQVAYASWYAGNKQLSAYGVKANIGTPTTQPVLAASGESSWVSAVGDGWVQTGWRYYIGYARPRPYTEAKTNGQYWGLIEYGTQAWGTYINYTVERYSSNCWRASFPAIGDGDAWCGLDAPAEMQVLLEVHESSSNQASTDVYGVRRKKADGSWAKFNQPNWVEDAPYKVFDKTYPYHWLAYGP